MALDLYGPGYVSGDSAFAGLVRTLSQLIDNLLASSGGTVPDADATTKGKLQLTNDLGGTAAAPTVPGLTSKLPLAGGTLTGALVLAANAAAALQAVPKQQLDSGLALKADDIAVVKVTGAQTIAGAKDFTTAPTVNGSPIGGTVPDADATTKGKLQLAGDLGGTAAAPTVPGLATRALDSAVVHNTGAETVAGVKTFSAAPVVPAAAFPESAVANLTTDLAAKLALAGGTLTGALVLAADPAANLQAAPKQYVDTGVAGRLALPTATAPAIVGTAGPLIPSPGASSAAIRETLRLPYTSALTSTNKTGQVVNVIGVTLFPDGSMPYPKGWIAIGDDNIDYIHFLSKIDCAGQPVIDSNFFGNSEGLYNPRLSQALDSTVGAYNTLTVGISTMPSGGVGYLAAIDRLVFNSGQTTANSKATFKNLGSVELLSDTMALKFGALGDASLSYLGAGVKVTGAGGLYCNIYQDTGAGGTYFEFAAGKLLVQPRGGDPAMDLAVRARMMPSTTTAAGLRVPHGSAPTSPVDGDVWTTTAGLFVRINGVTKTVTLT